MRTPAVPPEFAITEEPKPLAQGLPRESGTLLEEIARRAALLEDWAVKAEDRLNRLTEETDAQKRKLFLNIIEDVLDKLDLTLAAGDGADLEPGAQRWFKRLERNRRLLEQTLAQEHVVPFDTVTAPPGSVTIARLEERDDVPDGTVIAVNWRGYLWRGEILRKANVDIALNSHSGGYTSSSAREEKPQ